MNRELGDEQDAEFRRLKRQLDVMADPNLVGGFCSWQTCEDGGGVVAVSAWGCSEAG